MKRCYILYIILLFNLNVKSQTISVTTSAQTRVPPKVGYMLNYLTKPEWTNQSFLDSVRKLNPSLIRYPGGTESQYFDWQTGRSIPSSNWTNGSLFNHSYIGIVPHVSHTLNDLLYFYQITNVKPVFCLNLLTKTLSNQIEMLQTANSMGIPVEYIELGNELYFEDQDFINKYPNPIDYVLDMKDNWIPQLTALFPNANIAVIGSYDGLVDLNGNIVPSRISNWNSTLYAQNLSANAITFHYYIPPNTTLLSNPNASQALAAPFKHWPTLQNNTLNGVTNGMECWITEYNLNDGNQTNYAIASSWIHGLYTASLFSLMLVDEKIKMLLNHQIAGSPAFASLASYTTFGDTISNRLTAEGNAMRILHKAIKGKASAKKLQFSLNPLITIQTTNYPSLLGWFFENTQEKALYVLNLSNTSFTLDVSANIVGNYEFEIINTTNPLLKNITSLNLNINKGINNGNISIPPFSLLYITDLVTLDVTNNIEENSFIIFPNPANDVLTIKNKSSKIKLKEIQVLDILGRLIISKEVSGLDEEMKLHLEFLGKQPLLLKLIQSSGNVEIHKILKQ